MANEKLCLNWNDFRDVLKSSVGELRDDTDFTDVTLVCEDQSVKAHKVILSACSPFFKRLLKSHPHPQPLICMRGIKATDLVAIVDFIYHGEANIFQEQLENFLALAEELELKGLSGNSEEVVSEFAHYPPPDQEHFLSQNKPRTHFSRENNRNGGLPSKADYQGEIIPIQGVVLPMQPKSRQSVHIEPDTMAKINSMIEKKTDGYSCTNCSYTSRHPGHMREHVEKHIEGLEYACSSCDRVFSFSLSLRDHKRRACKILKQPLI